MGIGIYKQTARDIMTTHLVTIRPMDTVHDALLLMAENRLAALPVIDQAGKCLGMVSQSDIISIAREKDVEHAESGAKEVVSLLCRGVALDELTDERVEDLMSDRPVVACTDDSVTDLADKMLAAEIHHIPVVDDGGKLLGMVSTMDILAGLRQPI